MQQLESGEDFGHLAMFNSECPSKAQGGDLGWFGKGETNTHIYRAAERERGAGGKVRCGSACGVRGV